MPTETTTTTTQPAPAADTTPGPRMGNVDDLYVEVSLAYAAFDEGEVTLEETQAIMEEACRSMLGIS